MAQKSTAAGLGSWFSSGAFIGPFVFPVFVRLFQLVSSSAEASLFMFAFTSKAEERWL